MQRQAPAVLCAGAGLILAACAAAPSPQPAEPLAVCHTMFDSDAGMADELSRSGADMGDLCACYVSEHDKLDAAGQANLLAVSETLIRIREENGFAATEDAVEVMEEDRDGTAYGFPPDRLRAAGETIEEAILRARRDPAGCTAP